MFVLLHFRTGYAVKTDSLAAVRKTNENTRCVVELVVLIDVHGLDEQGSDILSVHTILTERNLRLEVLGDRVVHVN